MFKLFILGNLFFISIFISGCSWKTSTTNTEKQCIVSKTKAPLWACDMSKENNKYTSMTSTVISNLNENDLLDQSIRDTKREIINSIKADIKNRTNNYINSIGQKNEEMSERITTLVLREILQLDEKVNVSVWKPKDNSQLFVQLSLEKSKINNTINREIKNLADNNIVIKDSEDALNKLD